MDNGIENITITDALEPKGIKVNNTRNIAIAKSTPNPPNLCATFSA